MDLSESTIGTLAWIGGAPCWLALADLGAAGGLRALAHSHTVTVSVTDNDRVVNTADSLTDCCQ
jgi:hypothetical protein